MRKTALLWLLLAAVCGAILFQTSQRVNDGRQKLAEIGANTKKQEESLRVLQAEWSYLNQPERLEKLSQKYLGLVPLQGKQFAKTSDIPARPPQAEKTEATAPQVAVVEEKPVVAATKPAAPVVKIQQKPVTPPTVAQKPAAPVRNPSSTAQREASRNVWREAPRTAPYQQPAYQPPPPSYQPRRGFNDVMKSLGVE